MRNTGKSGDKKWRGKVCGNAHGNPTLTKSRLPQGNVTSLGNHCTLPDLWGEVSFTLDVCDVNHYN